MTKNETAAKVPVDMEKCLRISKKILELMQKKTKNSVEAYLTVRLLGIFFEEKLGFRLTSDQEEELRKLWRKDRNMSEKGETRTVVAHPRAAKEPKVNYNDSHD